MENKIKPYITEKLASGWVTYTDESGKKWRREDRGSGIYSFYEESESAFVHAGTIFSRNKNCKVLHDQFLENTLSDRDWET